MPSIQLIEGSGKPGSGPPGAPDMPTVHYFDCMEIFGFHVEIAMNSAGRDDRAAKRATQHPATPGSHPRTAKNAREKSARKGARKIMTRCMQGRNA